MKLFSKKFLAVTSSIALLASGFMFTSCSDDEGDGGSSGNKYDLTAWADATDDAKTEDTAQYKYKRYFKQLGSKEKVSGFNATVTVDISNTSCNVTTLASDADKCYQDTNGILELKSNIGLMFDYHNTKDENGKDVYDAVIIGYRPYDKGFYVEHYSGISADRFSTTEGGAFTSYTSLGAADNYITATSSAAYVTTYADQVTRDAEKKTDTFTITVTQETAGTYTIKIGDATVGTYTRTATDKDDGTTLLGGLAAYANAGVGTLAKATFTTGKENITGSLFDDIVEE